MEYPAVEGYFMPAEWERHDCCWMSWPCRIELWRDRYDNACVNYAEVIRAIAEFEPVKLLAPPGMAAAIRFQLGLNVEITEVTQDDSWFRDNGPSFLIDGQGNGAGVSWHFNAWGNKYHDYEADDRAATWLLEHLGLRAFDGAMVLEGGAFDVDGAGLLITAEAVVLNPNRNPTLNQQQIEERLAMFLGIRKVIWLPDGLIDDDTDGHIDNVARFAGAGRLLHPITSDENDKNFERLRDIRAQLQQATDARGQALELIELPHPAPRSGENGQQLPRSYLNFYLANDAVIVPQFDDPNDARALDILREVFSSRKAVAVNINEIVMGGGGIHCITQQQPSRG